MSTSELPSFASAKKEGEKGAHVPDPQTTTALASAPGEPSAAFDPRDSFFPRELLTREVLVPQELLPVRRPFRMARVALSFAIVACGVGLAYLYVHFSRAPVAAPAAATQVPREATPNTLATGSIAPAAPSAPQLPVASIPAPAPPPLPNSAVASRPLAALTAAPIAAVDKTRAAPASTRSQGSLPVGPVTSLPLPAGAHPVTHTKAAAPMAAGTEASQEPAPTQRAALPASAAPESTRGEARTAACTEAVAALGLCVQAARPN